MFPPVLKNLRPQVAFLIVFAHAHKKAENVAIFIGACVFTVLVSNTAT